MINSVLHETILRDIIDIISDIKDEYDDAKKVVNRGSANSFTSIARATSDLVLVFPFMCDSTVSMETASMTAKAIERQCVSMLRLLFSACEVTSAENARDYLAQFHTNINRMDVGDITLDDFLSIMDQMSESGDLIVKDRKVYNTIKEQLHMMCNNATYFEESVNEEAMTDYSVLERYGTLSVLKEAKKGKGAKGNSKGRGFSRVGSTSGGSLGDILSGLDLSNDDVSNFTFNYDPSKAAAMTAKLGIRSDELSRAATRSAAASATTSSANTSSNSYKKQINDLQSQIKRQADTIHSLNKNYHDSRDKNDSYENQIKDLKGQVKNQAGVINSLSKKKDDITVKNYYTMPGGGGGSKKNDLEDPAVLAQLYKNMSDAQSRMMLDGDVKKANELMPSMMLVNYIQKTPDGDAIPSQFVCGVKCRLIPVDPVDIANRIVVKHSDKNVLMNFIRATTGEIGFIRDFLFAIDKAKIDALSQSRKGSSNKMWKVLERRSTKSKYRRYFSKSNDAAMITTLGISAELADYIKKENGINLDNPREARKIMEGYNLMGMVIIDEAAEADKFLWDTGEGYYESISFNNLERENSGGEYKKALNLMQKMYR